jgi:hypothetical protein
VRNRVAPKAARTRAAVTSKLVRMSVVMALVPVALVAAAQSASAQSGGRVAADSASFGLAGPVGIAAVVVGFGGLVVGLLRHRRREAAIPVARQRIDSRGGDRAA